MSKLHFSYYWKRTGSNNISNGIHGRLKTKNELCCTISNLTKATTATKKSCLFPKNPFNVIASERYKHLNATDDTVRFPKMFTHRLGLCGVPCFRCCFSTLSFNLKCNRNTELQLTHISLCVLTLCVDFGAQ